MSKNNFQALKGMRDFYPAEMKLQRYLLDSIHKRSRLDGFEEYDSPMLESLSLYESKSGQEIKDQLYCFKDKGEREISLRPEMTPSLARMIGSRINSLTLPVQWYTIARCFRYEKPQKGRLREFMQWNLDIAGDETVHGELACISCADSLLKDLGLNDSDYAVRVSHRAILTAQLNELGIKAENHGELCKILDKKNKVPFDAFEKMLKEQISDLQFDQLLTFLETRDVREIKPNSYNEKCLELLSEFFEKGLSDYKLSSLELAPDIVRGLDYYTGIVFEFFDRGANKRAICGGGRYDNLLAELGGSGMTAVGLGMGDVVLADVLRDRDLLSPKTKEQRILIFSNDESSLRLAPEIAANLRSLGIETIVQTKPGKAKKAFKLADIKSVSHIIFLNEQLSSKESLILRNTSARTEEEVAIADLLNKF